MLYMHYFGVGGDVLHKSTREAKRAKKNTVETNIVLTLLGFKTMKLPRGGGVFPYMGYIHVGMCSPKGYGFSAALVINRVSI